MFKGIYTPMISIFNEEGGFDKEATSALIEKLVSDKVDGIVVLGSIGEFFNLSHDEKKDYVKFITNTVAGRTKVIVGTGCNNINEVIDLNKCAKDEGADAVLIITPYFFNLDEQYVYEYFATISRNTELPIMIYNFPARTGTNLSADLVYKLATEFENIVGIKDTTDSISNVRKYVEKIKKVRKDFSIISGFDEYLIPNLQAGGDGIIGGLTNINGKLFVDAYKAFIENDFERVAILQKDISKMMGLYDLVNPFIVAMKEATSISLNLNFNTSLRNYNIKIDEAVKERIKDTINLK